MMKAPPSNPLDYSASLSECSPVAERLVVPTECAGLRLDQALARMLPEHSRSRLQAWLQEGFILLDGVAGADAKRKIWGGERVEVTVRVESPSLLDAAENIALSIVYEDDDILVVDKPVGLVVHPGSGNRQGTLLNALLHHAPQLAAVPRAGIVHRLDKDTSGLLAVAKTPEAQTGMVRQLQARTVSRRYLALVHGTVARDGTVDAPIGRHPTQRVKMAVVGVRELGGGKVARTHYAILERLPGATLLECSLETGRTHQIRVHMASIRHPLVGDAVYGLRKVPGDASLLGAFRRQALHAWRLALLHPRSNAAMAWEAPAPPDFNTLLAALRAQP